MPSLLEEHLGLEGIAQRLGECHKSHETEKVWGPIKCGRKGRVRDQFEQMCWEPSLGLGSGLSREERLSARDTRD